MNSVSSRSFHHGIVFVVSKIEGENYSCQQYLISQRGIKMTVVIGAVCGDGIRPIGTDFKFEPGIVLAADSRLIDANGTVREDGLKVERVGESGICGMASDNIAIPETAFHDLDTFLIQNPSTSLAEVVSEMRKCLQRADKSVSKTFGGQSFSSEALFGYRDSDSQEYLLFSLASSDGFAPRRRKSWWAIGSHADWVQEIFHATTTAYSTVALQPFDGHPGGTVPVIYGTGSYMAKIIDAALSVAKEDELAHGTTQGIGGNRQIIAMTEKGIQAEDPQLFDKLVAWQIDGSGLK